MQVSVYCHPSLEDILCQETAISHNFGSWLWVTGSPGHPGTHGAMESFVAAPCSPPPCRLLIAPMASPLPEYHFWLAFLFSHLYVRSSFYPSANSRGSILSTRRKAQPWDSHYH